MNELSIKVTIAGRTYPLTIDRSEEEKIRVAVSKINDNIKDLRDNYAVKDTQDLLAMTHKLLVCASAIVAIGSLFFLLVFIPLASFYLSTR